MNMNILPLAGFSQVLAILILTDLFQLDEVSIRDSRQASKIGNIRYNRPRQNKKHGNQFISDQLEEKKEVEKACEYITEMPCKNYLEVASLLIKRLVSLSS